MGAKLKFFIVDRNGDEAVFSFREFYVDRCGRLFSELECDGGIVSPFDGEFADHIALFDGEQYSDALFEERRWLKNGERT